MSPSRVEDSRERLLLGSRVWHTPDRIGETKRGQWTGFASGPQPMGTIGRAAYGVTCRDNAVEFMCGVEVASWVGQPSGLRRLRLPAARYAVFGHDGSWLTVGATWRSIWAEWSGAAAAVPLDLEVHVDGYGAPDGAVEIWIPMPTTP